MRVAIVAGPDPARAFPAAALALGLCDNGDDVLLLTGRRWVGRLGQVGVAAEEIAGSSAERGSDLDYRGAAQAAAMTPAVRDRLADWAPDLVVADEATLAGAFAAEVLALPWAQLHPHPLSVSREPHSPLRIRRRQQQELKAARETLELPAGGRGPLLHIVATLPALETSRANWPRNASVVGPLTWDPASVELPIPDRQAPLVMVSPPTAAIRRADLLKAALAGLRGMRMVGSVLEPYEEPVPWWASIGPGRQEPLLAQAAVVFTGGGHGMIVRALSAGVPLVLAPSSDELDLARRVERLGAAVVLRRVSPRSVRRAVDRVIDDHSYSSAARHMARSVAAADPVVLCHQTLISRKAS